MQTIEKALHQPMPFTTGGQTISDRLTAAKHSLAGSQLGKTICKATTEEVMAPKKKHLDYLLHCTNEPNVSIPSMANLLIERTQNPNWTVVYKSLITIHNIMCYGNERFSQYLASCNTTFNLTSFVDKTVATGGYDMSIHVRRYAKYIGEKIATYRICAFDFCKVKRGREDGLLRTMHADKLLKSIPILQNQIDALLEFQVSSAELNNGVINCSFILLFRDLIRLFACYNDGIINVLEKFFEMNKKQCREALDIYKSFLTRLDKVAEFLRIAESVGIDRGEIPDLTRAPASLLEALEAHLIQLEGGKPAPAQPPASIQHQQPSFQLNQKNAVAEAERQRYIELEQERLRQFEEKKKSISSANPFATDMEQPQASPAPAPAGQNIPDLLDLFQPAASTDSQESTNTNPFAGLNMAAQQQQTQQPQPQHFYGNIGPSNENPFATPQAPPVPPPPTSQAIASAHQQQEAPNPFATEVAQYGGYNGQQNTDDIARMTAQMSIGNAPCNWNASTNNPFGAPQPMYTTGYQQAMGGYPAMWNPHQQYQQYPFPQPGQLSYQQQQQAVAMVNQAAKQQQQQQQQQNATDPFGS